jgi:hypothetical protein
MKSNETKLMRWLKSHGKTVEWLGNKLDASVTVVSIQHWTSGRRPIPQRHIEKLRSIMHSMGNHTLAKGENVFIPGDYGEPGTWDWSSPNKGA